MKIWGTLQKQGDQMTVCILNAEVSLTHPPHCFQSIGSSLTSTPQAGNARLLSEESTILRERHNDTNIRGFPTKACPGLSTGRLKVNKLHLMLKLPMSSLTDSLEQTTKNYHLSEKSL